MMEIRNPAKFPTELYPAEKEFAHRLAEGQPCIVGNGDFSTPRPEEGIESGDNANVVRSEVIRFFAYGGNGENPVSGPIIYLQGAWISGDLDLVHASIPYALVLSNCHFDASMSVQHAECAALYLNGSRLAGGVNADGLTTKGNVNLNNGFSAEGEVRLLGANIGGNLNCAGGKFHNLGGKALNADGLTTKGNVNFNVNLNNGFFAEGEVRLLGANIGGDLECTDGKFHNPGRKALNADGLTTKGKVNLNNDFSAEGEVRLLGANIGGSLNCTGRKFHNPKGYALVADKLTTKGSVNLRGGFSAEGEVRLLGANIGGNLDCAGGKFHNPGGNALTADGLTTKNSVNLREYFSAKGEVRLLGTDIGGNLDCTGGEFHNPDGRALSVDGGNISGGLFWRNITCEGVVNLAYAKGDVLADDSDSWASCKVDLDGFTYNRFSNPMDAQFRIGWLAKRSDREKFSPLPYEQVAKVLFGMGHARDAREILLKKERLQTADQQTPLLYKIMRQLWDVFAGYGYRLRYTLGWMAFFIYFGTSVFLDADLQRRIVPHQPVVLANPAYQYAVCKGAHPTEFVPTMFSGYPKFNQFWFSVDIFIPLFNLHQETHWHPVRDERGGFPWLTLWYWFEIVAGWILTSLLLLSITGLLRPRQSSGEKD